MYSSVSGFFCSPQYLRDSSVLHAPIHESVAQSALLPGSFPLSEDTTVRVFMPLLKDLWVVFSL